MTIYGITNCKQTQKAIAWFTQMKLSFDFHDFKKQGISVEKLRQFTFRLMDQYPIFFSKRTILSGAVISMY